MADNLPSAQDLRDLRSALSVLQSSIYTLTESVRKVEITQTRILVILDGDQDSDTEGLRMRVKAIEMTVSEWARWKMYLKGMAIGMALTGITSAANLITILAKTVGGTP